MQERLTKFAVDATTRRDPRWAAAERLWLKSNPTCAVCGKARVRLRRCEVHHIVPVHINKALELQPENFITLCRNHHFHVGHNRDPFNNPSGGNWTDWNPNVVNDARIMRHDHGPA